MFSFTTKKHLNRRTFLKSSSALISLPFLDSMQPAFAQNKKDMKDKLVIINAGFGLHRPNFFPKTAKKNYQDSEYTKLINSHRNYFTVLEGLSHQNQNGKNGHSSHLTWLTGAERPGLPGFKNSISFDQVIASKIGNRTRFPYLNLATDKTSLSWSKLGVQIPSIFSPLKLYKKLFVQSTKHANTRELNFLREGKSILDTVKASANSLNKKLGVQDQLKLAEYFASIRDLEIQILREDSWIQKKKPNVTYKLTSSPHKTDIIKIQELMYQLMALALKTDLTRTIVLDISATSLIPVNIPGVNSEWHNLTHHGKSPDKLEQLKKIERKEIKALNSFLSHLTRSNEEERSLIEKTTVLFGSNLGNASSHEWKNLPILVAGGKFKHQGFVSNNDVPLANLFLAIAQQMNINLTSFAKSKSNTIMGFC